MNTPRKEFRNHCLTRRNLVAGVVGLMAATALGCNKTPEPTANAGSSRAARSVTSVSRVAPDESFVFHAPHRIVSFGDVHGDLQATKRALRLAGVLDDRDKWSGGDTVLVQVGDILDRGDDEVAIIDLLEKLCSEAKEAGGRVIVLAGNHEVMNVQGDFRYVTKGGFQVFNLMSALPNPASPRFVRFPVIARSRAAAFLPGGPYAKKLANFPVAVVVNDTVFVHGGLLPKHVSYGLGRINRQTAAWMRGKRSLPRIMQGEDAPNWTRVYSMPEVSSATCRTLDKVLGSLDVKRMVVGHTPQKVGITTACSGKVWRVDIGLGSFYGSSEPQVWQWSDGKVRILERKPHDSVQPAAAASSR